METVPFCCTGLADSGSMPSMKYWEIVADKRRQPIGSGGVAAPLPNSTSARKVTAAISGDILEIEP